MEAVRAAASRVGTPWGRGCLMMILSVSNDGGIRSEFKVTSLLTDRIWDVKEKS